MDPFTRASFRLINSTQNVIIQKESVPVESTIKDITDKIKSKIISPEGLISKDIGIALGLQVHLFLLF